MIELGTEFYQISLLSLTLLLSYVFFLCSWIANMKLPRLMLMLLIVTRKHPLLVCTSACFPTQLFNLRHEFIANITHVIVGSLLVCLFYMCTLL
jgi:hypothetical protein